MTSVPLRTIAGLHESVIDYANRVHDLRSPSDVLNELHDITKKVSLPVLGAARFPPKAAGWDSLQPGKFRFPAQGSPEGLVGRISSTGARQVPTPPVPGAVPHGSIYVG